jgi:hypothetical protein
MRKVTVLLLAGVFAAMAAEFSGTWKLDTAKSKVVGMPMPKEQTTTYTPKGSGYEYTAKGISATGEPVTSGFTYRKDGEEVKTTGFPYWDAITVTGGQAAKTTVQLKRAGKVIGTVTRTLSADGKSLKLDGSLTLPDGKKATYNYHYDKQ